jgi:hypothetical protein
LNLGTEFATVPGISGFPLLASSPTQTDDGRLAANTAAWWRISDK